MSSAGVPLGGVCINDISGSIVDVDEPIMYSEDNSIDEADPPYVLICDKNKKFSLIDPDQQLYDAGDATIVKEELTPSGYVQTSMSSGFMNSPTMLVFPSDSEGVCYIAQGIHKQANVTAYLGPCDINSIRPAGLNAPAYLAVDAVNLWYGMFGQYGVYYPAARNVIGNHNTPKYKSVGLDLLSTNTYAFSNMFAGSVDVDIANGLFVDTTDENTLPNLAVCIAEHYLKNDGGSLALHTLPNYAESNLPNAVNTCHAPTNHNIYNDVDGWVIEEDISDQRQWLSYSLCYPIMLSGPSQSAIDALLTEKSVDFLLNNPQYVRPLCRAYHIYSFYTQYSLWWTPPFFIPGPAITVMSTWQPMTYGFYYNNYPINSDKNTLRTCATYTNTDILFSDALYLDISASTSSMWFQVLRHERGTIVCKYEPNDTFIYFDFGGTSSPPFKEQDDMFYLVNSLNPEEYHFCDGFLFAKQQFEYSKFTKDNPAPILNGAWAPEIGATGQSIMIAPITMHIGSDELNGTSCLRTVEQRDADDTVVSVSWTMGDVLCDPIYTHGMGNVNQTIQRFDDGWSDESRQNRDFKGSTQAPYDTVFARGGIAEHRAVIPDALTISMSTQRGILDDVFDDMLSEIQLRVKNGIYSGVVTIEKPIYTILTVCTDQQVLYKAATSYQHVSKDIGISGWYINPLSGYNRASHSLSGQAFLTGTTSVGYCHYIVTHTQEFNLTYDITAKPTSGAENMSMAYSAVPFGTATAAIATSRVYSSEGVHHGIVFVEELTSAPVVSPDVHKVDVDLNNGEGLTFPKIHVFDGYVFTHSATDIIMYAADGHTLLATDQLSCVKTSVAEHTYIDRFDVVIEAGIGTSMIAAYKNNINE